jgi:hypothetical protein
MQTEFKLAVIGSRTFTDYELLDKTLKEIDAKKKITLIVSGGAVGADSYANCWAKENGKSILIIYPEWYKDGKYDKGAGFKRNFKIIDACDAVVAFTNGSKGTEHSIEVATTKGKRVKRVPFMEPQTFNAFVGQEVKEGKVFSILKIFDDDGKEVFNTETEVVGDTSKVSKYVGELKAAMQAIAWAKKRKDKVIISYHYEGVIEWVRDLFNCKAEPWDVNNKWTRAYREYVAENLTFIEKFIKISESEKGEAKSDVE